MTTKKKEEAAQTVKKLGLAIEEISVNFFGTGDIIRAIRWALDDDSEFLDGLTTVERVIHTEADKLWDIANKLQEMEILG